MLVRRGGTMIVTAAREFWRQVRNIFGRIIIAFLNKINMIIEQKFDRAHNTDTAGKIDLANLEIPEGDRKSGHHYLGSDSRNFRHMLRRLSINYDDYVFIDYGSGKGKALIL